MIKPNHLRPGDKIAAVSLSAGLAGAIPYRYEIGKLQLEKEFDIQIVEMKHTLKDLAWVKKNPQARADDLMAAFTDSSIKGIISTIGGDDSILTAKYIDINIIKNNPKVFMGYSDSTVTHFMCHKAGLVSFYGPSVMAGFAENQGIFAYTAEYARKALIATEPIGLVIDSPLWTVEHLDWFEARNQTKKRTMRPSFGRKLLQGEGIVTGKLMGGCVQVFSILTGTELWPATNEWQDIILFMEISESELPLNFFRYILRNLGIQGIWNKINGIIFGMPGGQRSDLEFAQFETTLQEVVAEEFNCPNLPILSGMNFGHTDPVFTIPYGVKAEINCNEVSFSILESGVST